MLEISRRPIIPVFGKRYPAAIKGFGAEIVPKGGSIAMRQAAMLVISLSRFDPVMISHGIALIAPSRRTAVS